jgi:hypothetical protein
MDMQFENIISQFTSISHSALTPTFGLLQFFFTVLPPIDDYATSSLRLASLMTLRSALHIRIQCHVRIATHDDIGIEQ